MNIAIKGKKAENQIIRIEESFKNTVTTTTSSSKNQSTLITTNQPRKEIRDEDWFLFVKSYLTASKVIINHLKQGDFDTEHQILVLTLAFNTKHSIEIIIKALSRKLKDTIEKNDFSHDIDTLFKTFKDTFKKNKKALTEEIDKFEILVVRYSNLEIMKTRISNCINFIDKDNSFFRYPDPTLSVEVNYQNLISQFTLDDVLNIEKDVADLENIVSALKSTIESKKQ